MLTVVTYFFSFVAFFYDIVWESYSVTYIASKAKSDYSTTLLTVSYFNFTERHLIFLETDFESYPTFLRKERMRVLKLAPMGTFVPTNICFSAVSWFVRFTVIVSRLWDSNSRASQQNFENFEHYSWINMLWNLFCATMSVQLFGSV